MSIQASKAKRKHFRIALHAAGQTYAQFAEHHGVTAAAICRVLDGKTTSRRLSQAIDRFIDTEFRNLNIQRGAAA